MRKTFLFLCFAALWTNFALGSLDVNEQLGVRSRGMGGAGRAISTTNEAVFLNPAGITQFKRFNLDSDYVHRFNEAEHYIGISLVDATSRPLAGAVDFHMGIDPSQGSKALSYFASLALAYPITEDRLMLGSTVKYAHVKDNDPTAPKVNQFTLDVGLLARLPYGISFGVVGYNLVPTNSEKMPLSVGFGVAFNTNDFSPGATNFSSALSGFTIAFDWIMRDLTAADGFENQLMSGAEFLLLEVIPLRAGYTYSLDAKAHILTVGTGFASNDLGLDAFYEQNLTTTDDRSLGVALRLLF